MNIKVRPGTAVVLILTQLGDKTNKSALPMVTTVMQVERDCLAVAEVNSANGLARIVFNDDIGPNGAYWYEYRGRHENDGHTMNVVSMEILDGGIEICAPFITD